MNFLNEQILAGDLENSEEEETLSNDSSPYVNKKNGGEIFKIINTNARSLCPKINSLVDCFEETGATIGTVTETWLSDGESLEQDIQDLLHGTGLGMICRNREENARGFSHGGGSLSV